MPSQPVRKSGATGARASPHPRAVRWPHASSSTATERRALPHLPTQASGGKDGGWQVRLSLSVFLFCGAVGWSARPGIGGGGVSPAQSSGSIGEVGRWGLPSRRCISPVVARKYCAAIVRTVDGARIGARVDRPATRSTPNGGRREHPAQSLTWGGRGKVDTRSRCHVHT